MTTRPAFRASSASSSNSSVRSASDDAPNAAVRVRRSTRKSPTSMIGDSTGAGSTRRSTARTLATSSRGENGFVM